MNEIIGLIVSGMAEPLTVYLCLCETYRKIQRLREIMVLPFLSIPLQVGTYTREERRHNFPIGHPKRRRRPRSRNVFSTLYVRTLDNEASWNRDLPISVNSSTGNEDAGTSDKCTFNEVLRSLDEMAIYYLLRREQSRTKNQIK